MKARGPRRIGDLVQLGDIGRLKAEAERRRQLFARVCAELPAAEAAHVVSAHIDAEGRLVIGVDSAAWAQRLRFGNETLLGRSLKVRVSASGEAGQ